MQVSLQPYVSVGADVTTVAEGGGVNVVGREDRVGRERSRPIAQRSSPSRAVKPHKARLAKHGPRVPNIGEMYNVLISGTEPQQAAD